VSGLAFRDRGTADIANGIASKAARKTLPTNLVAIARRKLDQLESVDSLEQLRIPPSNHLEALHREREGQHSIRINDRYRVCFTWTDQGARDVEIVDYH
jgi:proteic killer suppression protein